jgi:hypothetical protein
MEGLNPRHWAADARDSVFSAGAHRTPYTAIAARGATRWTYRKLAKALSVSESTVQWVWAQAQLKPHRLERYMASNDPEFETKAAYIIGLYLNPPQHAPVFCVDETTAIQALDRLDPVLPLTGASRAVWLRVLPPWVCYRHMVICGFEWEDRRS